MTRIELIRQIVSGHQAQKIRIDGQKVYVDAFTASMLVQIHDALTPENQAKFMALSWQRMVTVGWKLAKPATGAA
jgi:hypothetical protein